MTEAQHVVYRPVDHPVMINKGAKFIGNRIAAWRKKHGIQAQHTRANP